MRGRKPKPTAMKKLTGNAGKRPLNNAEPMPPTGTPECPPHLDAEAVAEWSRLTAILSDMGLLTHADKAAMAIYCQSWSQMIAAQMKLRKEGAVVTTPKGYPIQNPWLSIANAAAKQLAKILVEFGLTPASRARVKVPEKPQKTAAEEFQQDDGG